MSGSRQAYFVASHKVLDRRTLNEIYVPRAVECLNKFDVEILAVNESVELVEGQTGHDRLVILRFPTREEAMRWYNSPEYQSMVHLRLNSVEGVLLLAEGRNAEDLAAAGPAGAPARAPAPATHAGNPRSRPVYFVASHKVLDRRTLNEIYVPKAVECLNKFDVEILVVNENVEVMEGQTGHDRLVILRFPTREEAMRWYKSPEYQSMVHLRLNSVEGILLLAEGLNAEDLAAAERAGPPAHAPAANPGAPSAPAASTYADNFRSGELTTSSFEGWSDEIKREFQTNNYNGNIGTDLVFENDSVRVWHMTLKPGENMPVHRHVLTYFWTAVTPGRFLQRTYDGTTYESDYAAGLTHFYHVGSREFALHNLENVGNTTMIFCAVELKKESPNLPLTLFESRPQWGSETPASTAYADSFRSGELTTSGFDGWSDQIRREFHTNEYNGRIGTDLVFENDSVRVWHMTLKPGENMPVHRHVLTYFWTAVTPGRFLQRTYDGTTYESDYEAGLTHFYDVGSGEFALHNLENVGSTTMIFCAVELKKESHNPPLAI